MGRPSFVTRVVPLAHLRGQTMKSLLYIVALLAVSCVAATAQFQRLPIPQYVGSMRWAMSSPYGAVLVTQRNVFVAPSLASTWRHCTIAPFQRDLDVVGINGDTIDVLCTYGTATQPQRGIMRTTDWGMRWELRIQLDATVAELIAVHPGGIVCRERADPALSNVVVINPSDGGVSRFSTPFPPGAVLKGASNGDTVLIGVASSEEPLGVVAVWDLESQQQWSTLRGQAHMRRAYDVDGFTGRNTAILVVDGLLVGDSSAGEVLTLPREIDAAMCIEPSHVVYAFGEWLMSYRDRLYRWVPRSRQWETAGGRGGSVDLALIADTLVITADGRYPVMGDASPFTTSFQSLGPALTDASFAMLRQAGQRAWVGDHIVWRAGQTKRALVRWIPTELNDYDVIPFDGNESARVVGYGSVTSSSETWLAVPHLATIENGDSVVVPQGGVSGAGGEVALAAGAGQDADVAVSTMRVLRRPRGEATWQVVGSMRGMPFADAVLVGDTAWAMTIDPGLTSEDNVLHVTVFAGEREVTSLREVHRGRDRSVYRWACSTPSGMLVHVGNGLRLSNDIGQTWVPVPLAAQEMVRPVFVDGRLWSAGLVSGQPVVLWSTNGVLWRVMATPLPVDAVPMAVAVNGSHIVVSTTTGVYQFVAAGLSVQTNEPATEQEHCGHLHAIVDLAGRVVATHVTSEAEAQDLPAGLYIFVCRQCIRSVLVSNSGVAFVSSAKRNSQREQR